MQNGQIKFILTSKPNPDEYEYSVVIKSYSGKLWESCSHWTAYAKNSKDAKSQIISNMQESGQLVDDILSDIEKFDASDNPYFIPAREYYKNKYDPSPLHPVFSKILSGFGMS